MYKYFYLSISFHENSDSTYLIIEIIPRLSSPEIETLKIKINYQRLANYYSNRDTFVKLPYDKFNSSEIFKNLLSPFHRQCFLGNLDSQPSIIRPAKNKEILHYNSPSLYFVSTPVAGIVYPLSPFSLVSVSIAIHGILSHFFLPPSPFPRYFVSRCFVKGPLLYFSRWLASTDYLAGCHLELRIPDNSFPLMVLYEERLFPPLPSPSPNPGFTNDYRWKFLENWNLEVLHFLTSKNLFEFIPI